MLTVYKSVKDLAKVAGS